VIPTRTERLNVVRVDRSSFGAIFIVVIISPADTYASGGIR